MNLTTRNASSSTAPAAAATTGGALSIGRRTLGVGLAATVLAAGAYAYTASNTVNESFAGDGAGVVSGYAVSNISYTLDADDPTLIEGVSFDLDEAASVVRAKTDNGADYASCTNSGGTSWDCDFPTDPDVAGAGNLSVIATS